MRVGLKGKQGVRPVHAEIGIGVLAGVGAVRKNLSIKHRHRMIGDNEFRLRLVGADQGPNALGPYRTVEILKPLHLYQEAVLVSRTHKGGEVAEPLRGSELLNAHVMQKRMKQPFRVHTTSEIVERLIAREKLDRALSDHFSGSSLAVVASAMSNPFRYFNSSPEIIRLAVLMYVKYPLSLRNVEDL